MKVWIILSDIEHFWGKKLLKYELDFHFKIRRLGLKQDYTVILI